MLHNLVFSEDYQHKLKSRTVWSLVSRSNSFYLMIKTNSRSTVVLREDFCPVLASSSESICNNVSQPLHDCSSGLNIFPESRVAVANGGFQSNLQTEKERKKNKSSKIISAFPLKKKKNHILLYNVKYKEILPSRCLGCKSHPQRRWIQGRMRMPEFFQEQHSCLKNMRARAEVTLSTSP